MTIVLGVLLAANVAAIGYTIVALLQLMRFGRSSKLDRSMRGDAELPPITVLKPFAGNEPGLLENLRTFCDQDYPQFQVIFGCRGCGPETKELVNSLLEEFKGRDLSFVAGGRAQAANFKVANLLDMVASAKHGILVIADADTRADRTYLRRVAEPFGRPAVGAATCLYRGMPTGGVISQLGALAIDDQFIPSVLVATLAPLRFCLGATMAVRREALAAIGGFEMLASQLADDRVLGDLISRRGYEVALAPCVVDHVVSEADFASLWAHELRWARTNRLAQPLGFAFYFITYPLPLALLYLAVSRNLVIGGALVALAVALRLLVHYASRWALVAHVRDALWLIPIRDVLGLVVWAASWFGRGVRWGGRDLRVDAAGRIL